MKIQDATPGFQLVERRRVEGVDQVVVRGSAGLQVLTLKQAKVSAAFVARPPAPKPVTGPLSVELSAGEVPERDLARLRVTSLSVRSLLESARQKTRAGGTKADVIELARLQALDQQLRKEMTQLRANPNAVAEAGVSTGADSALRAGASSSSGR